MGRFREGFNFFAARFWERAAFFRVAFRVARLQKIWEIGTTLGYICTFFKYKKTKKIRIAKGFVLAMRIFLFF